MQGCAHWARTETEYWCIVESWAREHERHTTFRTDTTSLQNHARTRWWRRGNASAPDNLFREPTRRRPTATRASRACERHGRHHHAAGADVAGREPGRDASAALDGTHDLSTQMMGWKGPGSRLTRPARPTCGRVSTAHSASRSVPIVDPRAEWRAYTPRANLGSSRVISSRTGCGVGRGLAGGRQQRGGEALVAKGSGGHAPAAACTRGRHGSSTALHGARTGCEPRGGAERGPAQCRGGSALGVAGVRPSWQAPAPQLWPCSLSLSPRLSSLPSALITLLCPSTPPPPNASATTRPCICTGGVTPRACSRVGAASVDEIGTVSLPATCSRSE